MQPVPAATRLPGTLSPAFRRRPGVTLAKLLGLMALSALGLTVAATVMLAATVLFLTSLFG
jgi:hypothetical protein